MRRTHLAVLLSLIGGVAPSIWHEAVAQDDAGATAHQHASVDANEAVLRRVLGLSDASHAAPVNAVASTAAGRRAGRIAKSPRTAATPDELGAARWDAATLGLTHAGKAESPRSSGGPVTAGADVARVDEKRIRAILGLEPDSTVASLGDGSRRTVARLAVDAAAPTTGRRPLPPPSATESAAGDPVVATEAIAPTATADLDAVIPGVGPTTGEDLFRPKDSGLPQPRRQRRDAPLPAIADASAKVVSRRGGHVTPASLALPPEEVETLERVLRVRLRGKFRFDENHPGKAMDAVQTMSDDPLLGLLDALSARDPATRRATPIIYVAPNPDDPKRDVIAADVFRHLADRIGQLPEATGNDPTTEASAFVDASKSSAGTASRSVPTIDESIPPVASDAPAAPAIALWLEDVEAPVATVERVAAQTPEIDSTITASRIAAIGDAGPAPTPRVSEVKTLRPGRMRDESRLAARAPTRRTLPVRSSTANADQPIDLSVPLLDHPLLVKADAASDSPTRSNERMIALPVLLESPERATNPSATMKLDRGASAEVVTAAREMLEVPVFFDIFDPRVELPVARGGSNVTASSSVDSEAGRDKTKATGRKKRASDRLASRRRRGPGSADNTILAAMQRVQPVPMGEANIRDAILPRIALRSSSGANSEPRRIALEMLGRHLGESDAGIRTPLLAHLVPDASFDTAIARVSNEMKPLPVVARPEASTNPIAAASPVGGAQRNDAEHDGSGTGRLRDADDHGTIMEAMARLEAPSSARKIARQPLLPRIASGSVTGSVPTLHIELLSADRSRRAAVAAHDALLPHVGGGDRLPDVALVQRRIDGMETLHDVVREITASPALAVVVPVVFEADEQRLTPLEGNRVALGDSKLETMRGGFETDSGLKISFGIERAVYINGALVTATSLNVADLSRLSAGQAAIAGIDRASLGIIQSGSNNNAFAVGSPISTGGIATVVQNTLNDQKIQGITAITATVNSLNLIQRSNFQQSIQGALTDSIRH